MKLVVVEHLNLSRLEFEKPVCKLWKLWVNLQLALNTLLIKVLIEESCCTGNFLTVIMTGVISFKSSHSIETFDDCAKGVFSQHQLEESWWNTILGCLGDDRTVPWIERRPCTSKICQQQRALQVLVLSIFRSSGLTARCLRPPRIYIF